MSTEMWYEIYRPKTLDEYVWRDPQMRQKVEEWITQGGLPHLLFSGASGTGKTSLALLILRLLNIPDEDILSIKASRDRKIDDLQDKIANFVNAWAFNSTGLKYILLDEADHLSLLSQGLLRNEMDGYTKSCRFLMTCNYPNKIIPALHGRVQELKFSSLENSDFVMRAADVLTNEKVVFEPETLMAYSDKTYPNLRKCIGLLQQNTVNGSLGELRKDDDATLDYLINAIDLFKQNRLIEARKLIIDQADPEDYESLFRWLYNNLTLFGSTQDQQDEALLAIRKAIVYDSQVSCREINLSACLCELTRIMQPNI